MPSPRIHITEKDQMYFLTFTVVRWIDIFTSVIYFDILINNLKFYIKKYSANLYGYVFMTNHLHLILQCNDMIKFARGFKSYSAKQILKQLKTDNREYILPLLKKYTSNSDYQIWRSNNWPILIFSNKFFNQKLDYIHNNPVKKGYVKKEEDWLYSSARYYYFGDNSLITVDV